MSDVLAGLGFGTAWVAALAVVYLYQQREQFKVGGLALMILVTFAITATYHVVTSHAVDLLRYAAGREPMRLK